MPKPHLLLSADIHCKYTTVYSSFNSYNCLHIFIFKETRCKLSFYKERLINLNYLCYHQKYKENLRLDIFISEELRKFCKLILWMKQYFSQERSDFPAVSSCYRFLIQKSHSSCILKLFCWLLFLFSLPQQVLDFIWFWCSCREMRLLYHEYHALIPSVCHVNKINFLNK